MLSIQAASLAACGARCSQQQPAAASVTAPVASRKSFAGASVSASVSSRRRAAAVTTRAAIADPPPKKASSFARPDSTGRFGKYGGKYVPETLIAALEELEAEYTKIKTDPAFQAGHHHSCRECWHPRALIR